MGKDLIDEMLDEMDEKEKMPVVIDDKELAKKRKDLELDVEDINSIAEGLVKMTQDDRKKADKIFELFFTNLGLDKDRTEASKEAITRALELKIEASKNLIELLKIRTKADEMKTNIGIMFNSMPGKKAGIDLSAIRKEKKTR
jgi:hypothetical protein